MAAEAVLDLYQRNLGTCSAPLGLSGLKRLYLGGVAVLTLAAGVYLVASSLIAESWLTLRDQTGFTRTPPADLVQQAKGFPEVPPLFLVNNFKQLVLAYPGGGDIPPGAVMAAQRTFVVSERPRHHLRFFLSTTAVRSGPFEDKISWEDADIEYLIGVNDRLITSGNLNDFNGNKYFSFDSVTSPFFGPRMTLQLVLRNRSGVLSVAPERGPVVSLEYIDLQ
jgi:hypothetical protein